MNEGASLPWREVADEPAPGQIAILLFEDAPHVALGAWRGRDRWSFNGWWQVGVALLVSLPIRRAPTHWLPFSPPEARSS